MSGLSTHRVIPSSAWDNHLRKQIGKSVQSKRCVSRNCSKRLPSEAGAPKLAHAQHLLVSAIRHPLPSTFQSSLPRMLPCSSSSPCQGPLAVPRQRLIFFLVALAAIIPRTAHAQAVYTIGLSQDMALVGPDSGGAWSDTDGVIGGQCGNIYAQTFNPSRRLVWWFERRRVSSRRLPTRLQPG